MVSKNTSLDHTVRFPKTKKKAVKTKKKAPVTMASLKREIKQLKAQIAQYQLASTNIKPNEHGTTGAEA